jgi:hypothetical protein
MAAAGFCPVFCDGQCECPDALGHCKRLDGIRANRFTARPRPTIVFASKAWTIRAILRALSTTEGSPGIAPWCEHHASHLSPGILSLASAYSPYIVAAAAHKPHRVIAAVARQA